MERGYPPPIKIIIFAKKRQNKINLNCSKEPEHFQNVANLYITTTFILCLAKYRKEASAELCQAQVRTFHNLDFYVKITLKNALKNALKPRGGLMGDKNICFKKFSDLEGIFS